MPIFTTDRPLNSSQKQSSQSLLSDSDIRRNLILVAMLIVLGSLCFTIDFTVSSKFAGQGEKWKLPGDLRTLIELSEIFAHGTGIILISLGVLALDRRSWKIALIPLCSALATGIFANFVKVLTISRYRPREFFQLDPPLDVSFQKFVPILNSGNFSQMLEYIDTDGLHSFPSAHAATAAGLWVGLSALYPQGRWYFAALAVLSGLQRIISGAHFPSDVCFGGAAGLLFATLFIRLAFFQNIIQKTKVATTDAAASS